MNVLDLIPNSRRDDFIDNETKGLFYNEIERVLGLPVSKKIRLSSRLKSKKVKLTTENAASDTDNENVSVNIIKSGDVEKNMKLDQFQLRQPEFLNILINECKDCPVLEKIKKNWDL